MYKFHKDGTLPENGEIFVFGSNLAGIHGAGAAKVAKEKFGAIWGKCDFFQGQSYAIPTKDENLKTLPLGIIGNYLDEFIEETHNNPGYKFFVTRIGCGLAGYKDEQIAPLFLHAYHNCSFAEEWRPYLES